MSPGPMLMAFGLFGLILTGRSLPGRLAGPVGRLSRASFCIYLVHIFFLRLFQRLGLSGGVTPSALTVPAVAALMAVCGWLVWEILRRIPVVNTYLV